MTGEPDMQHAAFEILLEKRIRKADSPDEAAKLDLRPGVLEKYLYENAEQLFFSARKPRSAAA